MRDPEVKVPSSRARTLWALLGGVAGGAAAGAAIMYLNAPRSGVQSRAKLLSVADNARDKVTRSPHALREATHAAQRAFAETLAEQLERG